MELNLDCRGQGRPTVILESGLGVPAIGWIKVQPEVANFARVCSYDRAGYGWSESGPEPRTSLQCARELKALLDAAGEKGPYLLVGHSVGGFNVRVFAGQYPREVAGVVLVDASHEDEVARIESSLPPAVRARLEKAMHRDERLDEILDALQFYLGIERFNVATGRSGPDYVPRDLQQEWFYLTQQSKSRNAAASESRALSESVAQVRAAGNLGDLPLIVVTAGKAYPDDPFQTDTQRNIWIHVLQVEESHLSTRGRQIIVQDSDHMIPFERPDAIVSAIHELWSSVVL